MDIGVQLPEVERLVAWREYRTMAMAAEAAGFDSIWIGDHLLYDKPTGPIGPWECWSLLAALAAVTEHALIGPLVTPTGFRNPALLAKMASTVDEISGRRLVLGLGAGWNRREYEAFGYPFDRRVGRFAEAFEIITSLIRTGHADLAGEFHTAEQAVLIPPARPDLPIMIGSTGPRMLAISAGQMDWWNEFWLRFDNDPTALAPLVARVDAALETAGRDPSDVTKSVALFVQLDGGSGRRMGAEQTTSPISGPDAEIAARILEFAPLVDHVQLVIDPITVESIERLGPVVDAVHDG